MFNSNSPSLADIAAVTNNDGFGGSGGGWAWILIILFALFGGFGWGGAGYAMGGSNAYATASDVQRGFDNQTLIGKIDGQTYGIADLGYALNTQFSQAELSRANQQAAVIAQINANNVNNMQNTNAIQTTLAGLRYDAATNACAITNAINNAAQQIIQNDNANYRSLHDENIAMQMAAKDDMIAQYRAQIEQLNLDASQSRQNAFLIKELRGGCNSCCGNYTSCCA